MNKMIKIEQLRKALIKDFNNLYVKEFTTDSQIQRVIRQVEINIMPLDNVMKLINPKETKNV